MDDQVRVSVKVQSDEGKKTENNYDKCKTGDKKGVDCVQNVQHPPSNTFCRCSKTLGICAQEYSDEMLEA